MRRALLSLLIFTLLSTGIVWASDTHVDMLPGNTAAAAATGCLYDAPVDEADYHQSHGCHMSSHLLAMASVPDELHPSGHHNFSPTAFHSLISRHSAPPVRPPRV